VEHFTVEGQWWLPAHPARRVPGTLTFDGDGLELVLYDALREFEVPEGEVARVDGPDWKVEPIVHGRTRDGRVYTLFEVGGANLVGPFDEVQEVYRPEIALAGCHTGADNFAEVWCSFDFLDAWADPPAVVIEGDDRDAVQVRLDSVDLAEVGVGGASVRLVSGVEGTAGGKRVQLTRWTSFAVKPAEPRTAKALIDGYARPLQDLLIFCLGRAVRLTSLRLLPTDLADPREGTAEAFFAAVQPARTHTPTVADIENYSAPTILSMRHNPVTLDQLLSRWFDLRRRYRDLLTLLLAPLYAPFIYSEHGFASTFQSAEALHDLVLPTRDVSKAEHRGNEHRSADMRGGLTMQPRRRDRARYAARGMRRPSRGCRLEQRPD
jgi:ApeA N-terminal domain 1